MRESNSDTATLPHQSDPAGWLALQTLWSAQAAFIAPKLWRRAASVNLAEPANDNV